MTAMANTPDPAPSSSSTRPASHSSKNLNNSRVPLDDEWLPGITFNSGHHCSSINSVTMPQSIRTTTCMPPPLPQQQRDDRRHTTPPEMIPIMMRETTTRGPRRPLFSTTTTNQEEQDRQQQEPQQEQQQQATTTRRRVHFAPPVDEDFLETSHPPPPAAAYGSSSSSSSVIVALDEPSPPLISAPGALWWQSPELAYMKRYSRWVLKNVHPQDGGGSDELLGLDRFTPERIANKKRTLRLVLLAQRYQPHRRRRHHHAEDQHQEEATASSSHEEEEDDENKKDAEYLRMVSRKCSYWTRNIAYALAQRVYIDLYMTPPSRGPPDEQQQQQYHQGQEVPRKQGQQMEQENRGLVHKRCFEAINSTSQEERQHHQEQSIDDSRRVRPRCSSSSSEL